MSGAIVWVDGALRSEDDARISPFDHGLLTGDGVFETLRVYRGEPFAWRRHWARLERSATSMGLSLPPESDVRTAASSVLEANALAEARLRITITGGAAPLGSSRGAGAPMALVAATPLAPWPATTDVAIAPWPRNERGALAGIKTTSYGENVRALAYAEERGAGEAVFANTQGNLCEGTGTNVFFAREGALWTPPESAGCLAGVTRALVIELCDAEGIETRVEDAPAGALARADEAFVSSTTREVQPVARVDGAPLPAAPGPITARLAKAFSALVERTLDP